MRQSHNFNLFPGRPLLKSVLPRIVTNLQTGTNDEELLLLLPHVEGWHSGCWSATAVEASCIRQPGVAAIKNAERYGW